MFLGLDLGVVLQVATMKGVTDPLALAEDIQVISDHAATLLNKA
jgi:hypothetical protein